MPRLCGILLFLVVFNTCIILIITVLLLLNKKPNMMDLQTEASWMDHIPSVSELTATFQRLYTPANLTEPTLTSLLAQVKWLEDLSGSDDPLVCDHDGLFILAVVPSLVTHFKVRQSIRNTWANPKYFPVTGLRTVFVVGATEDDAVQAKLQDEMNLHHDIIQNTVLDTYRNLTYKTISWLSWVADYCPDTPFIAKVDDDVMVNPFHLFRYLAKHMLNDPAPSHIIGILRKELKPIRNPSSKWAATVDEYSQELYPDIVLGPAYIVGRNAVDRLLEHVPYTPFFHLEDVYTTGLLAGAAGLQLEQAETQLYTRSTRRNLYSSSGTKAFLIEVPEHYRFRVWQRIEQNMPKVSTNISVPG